MMCFKKNAISVCGISCLVGKLMLQNRDQMSHEQMISYTNITHLCLMMGSERVNLSPDCRSSAQRIIEISSISHVSSLSISTRYMYIYIWVCLNNFQIRIVRPYLAGLHDSLWVVDTMRFQGTWSKRWLKALPKVSFLSLPGGEFHGGTHVHQDWTNTLCLHHVYH